MKAIRAVFVSVFTIINGYFVLPYAFKKLDQLKNEEIDKNKFKNSVIKMFIIIIILFIIEINYLGDVQQRILDMQQFLN